MRRHPGVAADRPARSKWRSFLQRSTGQPEDHEEVHDGISEGAGDGDGDAGASAHDVTPINLFGGGGLGLVGGKNVVAEGQIFLATQEAVDVGRVVEEEPRGEP